MRFLELDSLRGIAALSVVLYHYTTRYDELYGHSHSSYLGFDYGHLGVNLFFIISGFVIFMTLTRTNSFMEFAKKRVVRLFPVYIVAVVITFTLVSFYGLEGRTVSLLDGIVNLTMLQGFLPGVFEHVDGVYWSLTVELIFYIFIGLILIFNLKDRVYWLSAIWLGASTTFQVFTLISGENIITRILLFYSIADYAHLFVIGIMFYLMKGKPYYLNHLFILIGIAYQFAFNDFTSSVVVTGFVALFYLLIHGKLHFLNNRFLTFFGAISYSLYLIHQNIGYIVINIMENNGLLHEIYLIIPLMISIGLATLLTYYIEKPALKHFRNKSKNYNRIKKQKLLNA